jgi:aspartyl-tRNA(Asn)/glutamyl-tRNA(Gln) amidotransferase subunit A
MPALDVSQITIGSAGIAFRSGRFTPLALTEEYLRRIERLDPLLNSYITVTPAPALAEAQKATEELAAGIDRGPLHGIPVAYKDLFDTAGVRTTAGSRIYARRVPEQDAAVVRLLSRAGAVSLGKLNMLEFAYGVVHPDYGPARNPWHLERSSSGSSSGSAVAVAAGLCLASLGSDTGGSIRLPAAWCGIVGHKPTYGLVSRAGVIPLSWSLDHVGPMTRTADDAALMLQAIAGYDPCDPGSSPQARFRAADLDEVDPAGLRVGVPKEMLETGVDSGVRRVVEHALDVLAGVCSDVQPVAIGGTDDILAAEMVILFAEASAYHQPWLRTRPEDYSPLTRDRLEAGSAIPAVHYIDAQRARRRIAESFADVFQRVDILALPAAPTEAMRIGETRLRIDGEEVDILRALVRITGPFNVTGSPAVSVPCGWTGSGLPVGLQLAGRPFEDHIVLAAARAFEHAHGQELSLPPLKAAGSENR